MNFGEVMVCARCNKTIMIKFDIRIEYGLQGLTKPEDITNCFW
jgi:hypothetical protein